MNPANGDQFFGGSFDDYDNYAKSTAVMRSDIYEKDGNYNIEVDVPGMKKEDVKLDYKDGYIKITAKRDETKVENANYLHRERYSGDFSRNYYVGNIDESKIRARFEDGSLKVSFTKEEPKDTTKPIRID